MHMPFQKRLLYHKFTNGPPNTNKRQCDVHADAQTLATLSSASRNAATCQRPPFPSRYVGNMVQLTPESNPIFCMSAMVDAKYFSSGMVPT